MEVKVQNFIVTPILSHNTCQYYSTFMYDDPYHIIMPTAYIRIQRPLPHNIDDLYHIMPAVTTTYRTDKDGILCRVVGQLVRGRTILRGTIPEWEGAERERERETERERQRERERETERERERERERETERDCYINNDTKHECTSHNIEYRAGVPKLTTFWQLHIIFLLLTSTDL